MCKNRLGLFAQKWLLFLKIWWIKFLQNNKQPLLLRFFPKIFIFDWVIAIFMFFDEWWRHVLVHLKKITTIKTLSNIDVTMPLQMFDRVLNTPLKLGTYKNRKIDEKCKENVSGSEFPVFPYKFQFLSKFLMILA